MATPTSARPTLIRSPGRGRCWIAFTFVPFAPRRAPTASKVLRWASNLGLVALNTLLLRLVFPLAAAGVAAFCAANGWGLLNHFPVPFWLAVPVAVIASL